jgi:DNA-directed RNA polymerase specialized sigma24 family protein
MSELLGVSANTLQARVSRALPLLKRCLEAKGWHDE